MRGRTGSTSESGRYQLKAPFCGRFFVIEILHILELNGLFEKRNYGTCMIYTRYDTGRAVRWDVLRNGKQDTLNMYKRQC